MAQHGMKRVPTATIGSGDVIVTSTPSGGDLAMEVAGKGFSVKDGVSAVSFTGQTYSLAPTKVGEKMSSTELAEDTWIFDLKGTVIKVVPLDQADHDI